ncbi:hypothetical protein O6H91_19G034200 [Diphasiastrum complanatum]|uniref:Uncharacterized protein n=2 Tax=Diphasiastrum complanatum TaxID=34168 RepID=A0ACC2AU84_DIPCM|nr:hypothetical protein O6H91_19G034200 [Diphasiastrum complanatum]
MAAATSHQAIATSGSLSRCNHAFLGSSPSSSSALLRSKHFRASAKPFGSTSKLGRGAPKVVCLAGPWNARAKDASLVLEAEELWQRVKENPYDGVPFTLEDFERSISKYDYSCDAGDVVNGRVFAADGTGALVDIGAKAPAFLPLSEASLFRVSSVIEVGLFPGVQDEFMVIDEEDQKGRIIISLKQLQMDLAWERVRQIQAEDLAVRGTIQSSNRGGVMVTVEALRAFLPFSHTTPGKEMDHWVGKELPLKFIELDEEQNRIVVSNRKALGENRVELGIGSVVIGTIQSVKPYGAFVDIGGGLNGLLHISQVSNERITALNTVLHPGDKLKVMILSQDRERSRVSLSTKKLEPTPGDMLRNPALVFEKADEMARSFRQRIAQAEAASQAQEAKLEDSSFGLSLDFLTSSGGIGTNGSNSLTDRNAVLHPL